MGRRARECTEGQLADVERMLLRGLGIERVAQRSGVPRRVVQRERRRLGLTARRAQPWTETQRTYLREHVGEQSVTRLAREVSRLGPAHSEGAVRVELSRLGLSACDLRTDLTVLQVAELIGRSPPYVLAAIRRKELAALQQDGAWRIWPSEVLAWIDADPTRIGWQRVGAVAHELWALARGLM